MFGSNMCSFNSVQHHFYHWWTWKGERRLLLLKLLEAGVFYLETPSGHGGDDSDFSQLIINPDQVWVNQQPRVGPEPPPQRFGS